MTLTTPGAPAAPPLLSATPPVAQPPQPVPPSPEGDGSAGGAGTPPPPATPPQTTPVFNAQLFGMAVQLLRDERQTGFRIDVETDSTVAVDQEGEQKSAMQMIQAVGGFMQSAMPMMQSIPQSIPLFGKLVLFVLRRFPIGIELEGDVEDTIAKLEGMGSGALGSMMGQNDPNAGKQDLMKVKQQMAQDQAQANQAKVQAEIQKATMQAQTSQQDHAADIETHQMEMEIERTKAGLEVQRAQIDMQQLQHQQIAAHADHERQLTETAAKTASAAAGAALAPQKLPFMASPMGNNFNRGRQ